MGKHSERLCRKIFSYMSGVGLCGRVVDLRHRLQQHARRITDAIRLPHASRSMTENRVLHVERHLGSTKAALDGRGYNPESHAERDGQPAVDMFDAGPDAHGADAPDRLQLDPAAGYVHHHQVAEMKAFGGLATVQHSIALHGAGRAWGCAHLSLSTTLFVRSARRWIALSRLGICLIPRPAKNSCTSSGDGIAGSISVILRRRDTGRDLGPRLLQLALDEGQAPHEVLLLLLEALNLSAQPPDLAAPRLLINDG